MGNLLDGFKAIDAKPGKARHIKADKVWIEKGCHRINISSSFSEILGWEAGTRVDILSKGKTIALVPNRVGVFTIRKTGRLLQINSISAALKVASITGGAHEFNGWVDDGVLFFRPEE